MPKRLTLGRLVSESMIHIIEPIADQSLRFVLTKLGLMNIMKDNIQIESDFREQKKITDGTNTPQVVGYRTVAKLLPSVNPHNNKWEGYKTVVDLGNGNAIVRQGDVHYNKKPWTGKDITGRDFSIFHDNDLYVDITEWNVGSSLAMEVRMDFNDLTNAQDALAAIFATFTNGDMVGYIPIQYEYPIPVDIQYIMKQIFRMSSTNTTNDSYAAWIKEKSGGTIGWNVNRNDLNTKELVGKKNNIQALYLIECTQDQPEVGNSRFTVTFTLTVQYSRTNRLIIDYPIIVNNQLLDFDYVSVPEIYRKVNRGPFQWQNSAVDAYWRSQFKPTNPVPIMYPWWDKWWLPEDSILVVKGYQPIFIAAVTLDDISNPNGVTVLDLVEGLPGYKLSQDLIDLLQASKRKVLGFVDTYVNVSVFAHDYQVNPNLLDFNGRYLTLKSRQLSSIYRLVISIDPYPVNMQGLNELQMDKYTDLTPTGGN